MIELDEVLSGLVEIDDTEDGVLADALFGASAGDCRDLYL